MLFFEIKKQQKKKILVHLHANPKGSGEIPNQQTNKFIRQ